MVGSSLKASLRSPVAAWIRSSGGRSVIGYGCDDCGTLRKGSPWPPVVISDLAIGSIYTSKRGC